MKYLNFLAFALVLLGVNSNAKAAIITFEGFDYADPVGTSVAGLNGGTGWAEAYPSPEGTVRLGAGLAFTGHFASVGQSMERLQSGTLTSNGRNWASSISDGTYWYSFLMNPTSTATTVGRGTFGILQGPASNQNGFGIRYDFTGTAGPSATLTINANTPAQAPGANISFASGWDQSYLIVGKLTVNTAGNTINDVWAFQNGATLPISEVALGTAMSTSSGSSTGINPAMYGRAFGGSAPTFFDEVRIGTEFADVMVTAVPEPSSLALLGVLASVGAFYRRRKGAAIA